jgi:hypothetical protein
MFSQLKTDNLSMPDTALFLCQILVIFIVVCVSLINLSLQWGNQQLWTVVLTSCLGYIMPNPRLKLIDRQETANPSDNEK